MKRIIKNVAALLLGLVLGSVATYASAETIAATVTPNQRQSQCPNPYGGDTKAWSWENTTRTDPSAECTARGYNGYYSDYAGCREPIFNRGCSTFAFRTITLYSCPASGGWTLDGTNCTRTDCAPGQQRDANGICQTVACPTGQFSSGYYRGSAPGGACAPNGCDVSFTGSYPAGRDAQGNLYSQGSYSYTGGNQGTCTPGQDGSVAAPGTSSTPLTPTKPGPNGCAPGDGVMTSSSGKVACVPQGTEGSTPAVNNKTSKTETYADGSTKTTTTTEVCTGEGACSSTTTITIGAASGGGAGQAGAPGSSSVGTESGRDSDGDGDVDSEADCDPSSQMCGSPAIGDLYAKKGKTMQAAFTSFSNGLKASPMGQAATGFFTVSVPSGACPSMSANVDYLGVSVNLADHICTAAAVEMMQMAGAVLFVLATFVAFRWAFL